jgi:hypothetical protein
MENNQMDFGDAIVALKRGECIQRSGWNGKGMFLYLEKWNKPQDHRYDPVIVIHTAARTYQPGWLASQADMLADDWSILSKDQLNIARGE